MRSAADLHSQIASIVEVLANAAVAEICKAVEDEYAVVNVEMSRSQRENECLRRRVKLLELQVSRYRAEQRLKAQDGTGAGRLVPGARLLQHRHGSKDAPAGPSLQIRPRFLNRPPQKSPVNLNQDPNQEVVTTTKTESTEPEEDNDIIIVKVEGSVSVQDTTTHNSNTHKSSTSLDQSSEIQAQSSSQTESQKSQERSSRRIWSSEEQVVKHEGDLKKTFPPEGEHLYPVADSYAKLNELLNTACQSKNFSSRPSAEDDAKEIRAVLPFDAGQSSNSPDHFLSSAQTKEPAVDQNCRAADTFPDELPYRPHACLFCPRLFAQETELISHERVHRAVKPYQCDQCHKVFDSFCHLKRHKLVHTGARPYPCARCGKRFSTFNNLKVHQSVHTGERKFLCKTCGKTYAFHSNLIRHQAVHVKEAVKVGRNNVGLEIAVRTNANRQKVP